MSKNQFSKTGAAVQSLIDFANDVKPYHSKITQVIEEYQFFEDLSVKIEERMFVKTKIASTWVYKYFSSGNPLYRTMPAARVLEPAFLQQTFTVGQDENTDLALVPYAYSKKSFDGPGVNQVLVHRGTGVNEPLTESVDYFQSHGSFQFQIKQTLNANDDFDPTWSSTNDDGLLAAASVSTRALALDTSNPTSAVRRIQVKLNEVQAAVTAAGGDPDVQRELDALFAITNVPDIPRSYEALLSYLSIASPPIVPYTRVNDGSSVDAQRLEQEFSNLTSPLFFGNYTDMGQRQSGRLSYLDAEGPYVNVRNIVPDPTAAFEEWTLTAVDDDTPQFKVVGSSSGFVGFLTAGDRFWNKVAFDTEFVSQAPIGAEISFAPVNKLVIRAGAPLETWNIIKVNSIAHDRPVLVSTRYGSIQDLNGVIGSVSLLDQTFPSGTIILTARQDGLHFDLTSSTDPSYTAVVTVGSTYNDGKIGLKLQAGTTPFRAGDRFYIGVENLPAAANEIDLGYGYDLESYDNYNLLYNNTNPAHPDYNHRIGFYYDGRFSDYSLDGLNIQVAQAAIHNRKWRVKAKPTGAQIATLKKDGSGPSYSVDLTDATSGTAPDPALSSVPVYSMPGAGSSAPDLNLFYATEFDVQYSDDDFSTSTSIGSISVGNTFQSVLHGIQFTVLAGSKPFIAVSSDDGSGVPRVEGGDVFSFTVKNPWPTLVEAPVGLSSAAIPRLIMHSDSFYDAPAARFTVTFTSGTEYVVNAVQDGVPVPGAPVTCTTTTPGTGPNEGLSFKGLGVHFTIVPAGGLGAGDKFTFNTFAEKPSYLVHGSVTGWTAPATADRYYWNGFIGFKLTSPKHSVYLNGVKTDPGVLGIQISHLREDTPSLTYIFTKVPLGYMVSRTDVGVLGFVPGTGVFSDVYLTAALSGAVAQEIRLDVNAHDFTLWNSQDLVILNPRIAPRLPAPGEKVIVEKTEKGRLSISLTPSVTNLSALAPITIDQRFIGPESELSPEMALLQGWLPMTAEPRDSVTSIAQFSDVATSQSLKSAARNLSIGTLKQQDPTELNEPIIFEWDPSFFSTYLPINAEASLVISSPGWDDKINAHITESLKVMISGGALAENWLFHDDLNAHFTEMALTTISSKYADPMTIQLQDGPFSGFLPGFANVPYDDDDGYDTGQPPDLYSLLSKANLTAQEEQDVLDRWDNFLLDNAIPTTEAQWAFVYAALTSDPNPGTVTDDTGFPALGLGFDISAASTGTTATAIKETAVIVAHDQSSAHDLYSYGTGEIDTLDESTGFIYAAALPPLPVSVPPGATYETLDTPLYVLSPARVFEVSFNASAGALAALNPVFSIWLPGAAAPVRVSVVEKIALGRYRFSIPSPSEAKILVT